MSAASSGWASMSGRKTGWPAGSRLGAVAFEPGEERGVRRGEAVPEFLDVVGGDGGGVVGGEFGQRGLGEAGGGADAQRPGDELDQRVADRNGGGVEPVGDDGREVRLGGGAEGVDDFGDGRRPGVGAARGPEQGDGLGEITDVVARPGEQDRVGAGFAEVLDHAGLGGDEGEFVGEGGEAVAPIGVGGSFEVAAQQGDLGEAAGGEDEALEEVGEGDHLGVSACGSALSCEEREREQVVMRLRLRLLRSR